MNAVHRTCDAPADRATFLDQLPQSADCLRQNQRDLLATIRDSLAMGQSRILVQAETGFGKTHCISAVTTAACAAHMRVVALVTRNRLVTQLRERFERFGIAHGVIAAPFPSLRWDAAPVQIAAADTLYRRAMVNKQMPLPSADVVIFDEAHLACGQTRAALLDQYPRALHFGWTATPATLTGRSLRAQYDILVRGPSTKELIRSGDLVQPRVFSAPVVKQSELDALSKDSISGEYAVGESSALMSRPKLVGDVLDNYLRIAPGKRTLLFACDKAHGTVLKSEFCRAGIAAELLTDQDSEDDREAAIARLESGVTKVLINCFLLSYGIDIPTVECIVLARPMRSIVLYRQATGRGMRPAPGKDHVIVIDHGRVVNALGLPDESIAWTLDESTNVNRVTRAQVAKRNCGKERPRTCPECSHLWLVSEDGPTCKSCGWAMSTAAKQVQVQAATLIEIGGGNSVSAPEAVDHFYAEALTFYANRWPDRWTNRENSGRYWAWVQCRKRFEIKADRPPSRYWSTSRAPISAVTQGWLKAQLIAYAKARA